MKVYGASLVLIVTLSLASARVESGPDLQKIKLGQYTVYVPQVLFASRGYDVVTLDNKFVEHPADPEVDAHKLTIAIGGVNALGLNDGVAIPPKRPSPYVEWGDKRHVPYQISLSPGPAFGDWSKHVPLGVHLNRMAVEAATGLASDENGFVRSRRNFLVYKGSDYQTPAGDTLVVSLPLEAGGNPSGFSIGFVSIALQKDLLLDYKIATRDSSSAGLWDMHQEIVACVTHLMQTGNDSPCRP